jgi:hypothetical protein
MALVLADRVKETTTTTGTGTITLAGAATGYRSFSVIGNGNSTYYAIIDSTANTWEVGVGVYTSAGTTLSRTTVFSNSSNTTALINFAAGTKDVICTQPAWSTLNYDSVAIGYQALNASIVGSGTNNTAIGYQALATSSAAANNTAVGSLAMSAAVSNNAQVAVGRYALNALTSGLYNCVVGGAAGLAVTGGSYNSLFGTYAGFSLAGQSNNTAIGYSALYYNTAASNTAVGYNAGLNVNGTGNTAVGYQALQGNATMTGTYNTVMGWSAAPAVTSGQLSTILGSSAGTALTSAWFSVFIGSSAGNSVTSGDGNICIGYQTLGGSATLTTGTYNTLIGYRAGYAMGNGSQNLVIGHLAGASLTTGSNNVIIGSYDGATGIISMQASSNNVVIADNNGGIKLYTTTSGLGGFNVPMADRGATSATAATGTVNFDASTQQVWYLTANASANFTLNIRGNSTTTLNNALPTGQSLTLQLWNTNGASAFYMSAFTIDGTSVTPKWINGTAPSAGNANSIDVYTFNIFKTGASTYVVTAKQEKYA